MNSAQSRWAALLRADRAAPSSSATGPGRSSFQRDYDRIIYSASFRRLADKTQVFPVPRDDHVHSRLTHSLEVATIGRSLGVMVGVRLAAAGRLPAAIAPHDLGDCVAAACLAHDLGNPPFGHAGEEAIQEFFRRYFERRAESEALRDITERQWLDLLRFEGNAQSLRLVTRVARPRSERGLNLCFPTLGALVKYPCASEATQQGAASRKKHGVNDAEDARYAEVAEALELVARGDGRAWQRHPLAFLTEAADDIAYGVIDLEDGLRLGLVSGEQYVELLAPFTTGTAAERGLPARVPSDREERLELAGKLRSVAVDVLLQQVTDAFDVHHDGVLEGEFDTALIKEVPSRAAFQALKQVATAQCYRARDVLRMEIAGAAAIEGVLDAVVGAALGEDSLRADRLRDLVPALTAGETPYERLLASTDHVSGMTDGYVVRQYRELSGNRLPGGRD